MREQNPPKPPGPNRKMLLHVDTEGKPTVKPTYNPADPHTSSQTPVFIPQNKAIVDRRRKPSAHAFYPTRP